MSWWGHMCHTCACNLFAASAAATDCTEEIIPEQFTVKAQERLFPTWLLSRASLSVYNCRHKRPPSRQFDQMQNCEGGCETIYIVNQLQLSALCNLSNKSGVIFSTSQKWIFPQKFSTDSQPVWIQFVSHIKTAARAGGVLAILGAAGYSRLCSSNSGPLSNQARQMRRKVTNERQFMLSN